MAYYEERSFLECLCQFREQDMQFLEDRSVHKISIDKLFSYPMISKHFNPWVVTHFFSTFS